MSGKTCGAWMKVVDNTGLTSAWVKKGTLSFNQAPMNVSLSPYRGTLICERNTTFACKYADADGNTDIAVAYLLLNTSLTGKSSIFVYYDAVTNKLYLRNDANTAWLGGYTPGNAVTIENSQCKLDCSQTTIFRSGTNLSINWKIRIKQSMADKTISAWLRVIDKLGLNDYYEKFGEYKTSYTP
jgi:hypothetical protein